MSQAFQRLAVNLRKLFPFITADLNTIIMRFSCGSRDPYPDVDAILADLFTMLSADRL